VNARRPSGFTLIEMLVAITLLALVSLISWRGLDAVLHTRLRIQADADEVRAVLRTVAQLERDVAAARAPAGGLPTSALPGGIAVAAGPDGGWLELVRATPEVGGATPLQRVRYGVEQERLMRAAGVPGTQLPLGEPAQPVVLLAGVRRLDLQAYVTGDQQGGRWLPLPLQSELPPASRVTGLRIAIERSNGENYLRILAL
jgi:general secretion pathway protein J